LKTMNKNARPEHYLRLIPMLREAGILTHCSFIIGFPGETMATVEETVQLIENARPDTFSAQVWYCDPVTPIWNRSEQFGLKGRGFAWVHRTMDAATAMNIMEKLFLTVRNSVWLPQHGFELWSLFYLQRKGMALSQLMRFLRDFNEAIRFKLRHGGDQPINLRLLNAMSASSRFSTSG